MMISANVADVSGTRVVHARPVRIEIRVSQTQPPAGSVSTAARGRTAFTGWVELLGILSRALEGDGTRMDDQSADGTGSCLDAPPAIHIGEENQ